MTTLRAHDYRRLLGFVEQLHGIEDAADLPAWLVRRIPDLVGGHHCTWNRMSVSRQRASVVEYPLIEPGPDSARIFAACLVEHPCFVNYATTGDPSPFMISDFVTTTQYRRLRLYARLYRDLGYEDQLAMALGPPSAEVVGIALARDRGTFGERDRELLRLLRPHVVSAERNLAALGRVRERIGQPQGDESTAALLEISGTNRVVRGLTHAAPLLSRYFDTRPHRASRALPETLRLWLAQNPRTPLVRQRGGHRLAVRFVGGRPRAGVVGLVLLEETAEPRAALLTPRESEVLTEIDNGLTNAQVAEALFISPRTVKKHLDNIYTKLGVRNRTAALARFRRQK